MPGVFAAGDARYRLWGTLSATVLVDPRTRRDQDVRRALARAVAQLRYGTVAVNIWHVFSFITTSATWGGCPAGRLSSADLLARYAVR